MEKELLIVITGPTAVGKSELAAELARRIDGEVVSADSMQVYKYMDIGSAKITKEEMLGVPHHMIDVVDPKEEMDVARYAGMAGEAIRRIREAGHVPILCGGTGFYIQAVTRGVDFTEMEPDAAYRRELTEIAEKQGNEALHDLLKKVDPESAEAIHPNNVKRVIRALEFYKESGRKISAHNMAEKERTSPFHLISFVIDDDRKKLYERIDRRVDFMMEEGLFEEVAFLRAMGLNRSDVSMQGIGYKEILDAMDGKTDLEEAVRLIKRNSRRYAKRQLTWIRRSGDAVWLHRGDYGDDTFRILDAMLAYIRAHTEIQIKEVGNPYEETAL